VWLLSDVGARMALSRGTTYPGRGGLVNNETKGRRRRSLPIIELLRATLERLMVGRARDARLLVGPRGGVITTATLRVRRGGTSWFMILGWPASCGTTCDTQR
jgi:hypothetical protein